MSHEAQISFDDESADFDSGETSLPESGDFELGSEEISLDDTSGPGWDTSTTPQGSVAEDVLGTDLDTEDAIAELDLGGPGDDELGPDKGELELDKAADAEAAGDELSLDLGEAPESEGSLDLGALDLEGGSEEAPAGAQIGTGELRLEGESTEELDKLLDMDEISLEEIPLEAKAGSKKGKATKAQDGDLALDLGDLDLELDLEDSKPQ